MVPAGAVVVDQLRVTSACGGVAVLRVVATVTATVSVPGNAEPGIHQSEVIVEHDGHRSVVPVIIQVSPKFNTTSDLVLLGGGPGGTGLMEPGQVEGHWNLYNLLQRSAPRLEISGPMEKMDCPDQDL